MELMLSITCLIISEHFDSFTFSTVKLDQTLKCLGARQKGVKWEINNLDGSSEKWTLAKNEKNIISSR